MTPTPAQIEAAATPSRAIQAKCHGAVRRAIKAGILTRPKICECCGTIPRLNRSGVSQIHAHHHDHSKPLEVQWLCVRCHRMVTPWPSKPSGKAFGTTNGQARLAPEKVLFIRVHADRLSTRQIGELVGVHRTTVQRVLRGEHWTHVR